MKHVFFYKFWILTLMLVGVTGCVSPRQEAPALLNPSSEVAFAQETPVQKSLPPLGEEILVPYFVHKGDTLCTISQRIYGDESHAQELAKTNKLKDPNKIYAGDLVYYPSVVSTQEYTAQTQKSMKFNVVVRKGDTLWSLAKQVLGSGTNWRILWKMNPHIQDPNRIEVGMKVQFKPRVTWNEGKELPQQQADLL